MLIRIDSQHKPPFIAGVVLDAGIVVRAAPIVKYMKGWNLNNVLAYAAKRGWKIEEIS